MNIVKSLNAVSSQVWAVLLMISGVVTIFIANYCHDSQVVSALLGAGTSMVGGALILFQHQTKAPTGQEPNPAIDPLQLTLDQKKG